MNLTAASIRHPAAIGAVVMLISLFGLLSFQRLPIQLLPDLETPTITVVTRWRAAAPQEIEESIIQPQEEVLNTIAGVETMISNVSRGRGEVQLSFPVGWDMQQALIDVISNINQAPPLPADADEPQVRGGRGQNTPPAASLLLYPQPGTTVADMAEYQDLIDTVVEPRLARIPGAARVELSSERERQLNVTVDPYRLAAMGLRIDDVAATLSRSTDVSGGFADVGRRQYTVRFVGRNSVGELGNLVVGWRNSEPVYLEDVADIRLALAKRWSFTFRNGKPAYYMRLMADNDANTVELLETLNGVIAELNDGALADNGLVLELSYDASLHIRRAIAMVQGNLLLGMLLASAILWWFLRNLRATLVIALTIPVSLFGAFAILEFSGRSLNVISLAGLAFAVGLAMDAAIIVQENILRLWQQGVERTEACIEGARQVASALVSSTLTSVAIFLPILFIQGVEGQLFKDLAITLATAVTLSMFAALTILPVATGQWLKGGLPADRLAHRWDQLAGLVCGLTATTSRRVAWSASILAASALLIVFLMPKVDFLPRADVDAINVWFNMPPATNLQTLEKEIAGETIRRLEPYYDGSKEPRIRGYNFSAAAGSWNSLYIYPADSARTDELLDKLRNEILVGMVDTSAYVQKASLINVDMGGGRGIAIDFRGADLEQLMQVARQGMQMVTGLWEGGNTRPFPALAMNEPELQLVPDDKRLGQAGLDRNNLASVIRAYTDGLWAGEYFDGNHRYDMLVRGEEWASPEQLTEMPLATPFAGIQTIGELAQLRRTVGPARLLRVDGQRTVTLWVVPPETVTLEEAVERLEQEVGPQLQAMLPAGASIRYRGSADRLAQALQEMGTNFTLAMVILFAIMAVIFRSLRDSTLVLLVMPVAIAGGMVALKLLNLVTYQSLDMLTMIGFIILLGLVVNNAILLVDQTRNAERQGMVRSAAVYQAVRIRARPIFMSTLTSIFGMLPLLAIPGVGSEIYRGLAAVIVGGMLFSALFTLVLMPSLLQFGSLAKIRSPRTDPKDLTVAPAQQPVGS